MKQKKSYDAKELFLNGMMAFGNFLSNMGSISRTHLNKRQHKVRAAFKASGVARRHQRRLQHG